MTAWQRAPYVLCVSSPDVFQAIKNIVCLFIVLNKIPAVITHTMGHTVL